jgi:hypothetical protein
MLIGAAGTILIETLYPLALFNRAARWFFPIAMVGLLISIRLLIGPWFATFILAHLFWIPWSQWFAERSRPRISTQ